MAAPGPSFGGPQRDPEDASLVDFIKASFAAVGASARLQLQAPAAAGAPPPAAA